MADQYQKPYSESSVFIAWLKGEKEKGVDRRAVADHILSLAERGVYQIYTSFLTLAEVHKRRNSPMLSNEEDDQILAYFEHDFFRFIEVDRGIGEHANRMCREHGLYPNDAIHLASALRAGCDVLLTWDERLTRIQHPNVRIEEPQLIGQAELPEMPPCQ